MQCADCLKKYIGQTGRIFQTRFKEHIRDIKNNGHNSKFAQHILDTIHDYGMMEETMKPLHIEKKGPMLHTYERFHIYEITKHKLQLNDNYTEVHNPIYNAVISMYQNI
jgi:hypothetical protein